MAIQTILGQISLPPVIHAAASGSITRTFVATVTNAAGKVGMILRAPKAGDIRKIGWGTRTVTTGATIDVRVETVSSGFPSGSLHAANTNGAQVVANGDDNVEFLTSLTADATVTRGQEIALVWANASPGSLQMISGLLTMTSTLHQYPYVAVHNGTSWSANVSGIFPQVLLEYSDGSYAPVEGVIPNGVINATAFNTGSTPDSWGWRFRFPFGMSVRGVWFVADLDNASVVKLVSTAYNQGAGTGILASDTPVLVSRGSAGMGTYYIPFSSSVELDPATYYRLLIEPTGGSSITFPDISVTTAAQLDAFVGGADCHTTSAKDPTGDGDWTNYNSGTFRAPPFMGLLLDGFFDEDGAGSGATVHSSAHFG